MGYALHMPDGSFVSRGGLKLQAALDAFAVQVRGLICADLGCNVGGFTDCLLQHGATHVYSVDTGYGTLAWKLRQDQRVTTLERTNALHFDPTQLTDFSGCDLVVIDLGWTPQARALPVARLWLKSHIHGHDSGRIITLIKPHYEQVTLPSDAANTPQHGRPRKRTAECILDQSVAETIKDRVIESMPELGFTVEGVIASPIRGGASRGIQGNHEYLALLKPSDR